MGKTKILFQNERERFCPCRGEHSCACGYAEYFDQSGYVDRSIYDDDSD